MHAPFVAFVFTSALAPYLPGENLEMLDNKVRFALADVNAVRGQIRAAWRMHDFHLDRGDEAEAVREVAKIQALTAGLNKPLYYLWWARARRQSLLLDAALHPEKKRMLIRQPSRAIAGKHG
jgi:hypothetical protein